MNIPKLRFGEFHNEWKDKKLGEVSDVRDGTHESPKYINEGYPLVTSKNLMKNGKINFDDVNYISEFDYDSINQRSKVNKGDILFGMIGTIGNPVIVNCEGFAIKNVALIKENQNLKNKFLYQILKSEVIDKQFYLLNAGGTQKFVALGLIRNLTIPTPSILEQEKITSFLSKIDKKTDNLHEKRLLWTTYKKGMTQKLLNQELRFKDENGQCYPDWDEKKFKDIFDFISTNSFSRACLNNESGDVFNIHYGDIHTKFPNILNLDKVDVPFINKDVILDNIKVENYCKNGDLVIVDASEDYEDIGKAVELINMGNKKVLAGLHTILARDKGRYTVDGFRSYLLLENSVKLQLKKFATGVSVLGISKTNLGKIDLKIPSIQEQMKIAGFLSSVYIRIELINKELEINNEFKKGLLQQMFPN